MKIIIDECLPKRVITFFKETEYEVWSIPQIGLGGYSDKDLLDALDKKEIDLFITIDGNIEYQQNFKNRTFGTMIIRSVSNRFMDLQQYQDEIVKVCKNVKPNMIYHIP